MKQYIFLLAGIGLALPVSAAPNVPLKCGANQERVWIYDNLSTFDVGIRLKCGEPVQLLGMEKGYVRVRTTAGDEGYVAASNIPAEEVAALLPPAAPVPTAAPVVSASVASAPQSASPVPSAPVQPAMVAQQSATIRPATMQPATVRPAVRQPVDAPVVVASASPNWIAPHATAPAVAAVVPAAAPAVAPKLATAPTAAPTGPVAVSIPVSPVHPPVVTASAASKPAPMAPREEAVLSIEPATNAAPAAAPSRASMVKTADVVSPRMNSAAGMRKVDMEEMDDDMPDVETSSSENLSSCNAFFSAYGVTPEQYKWFAGRRHKQFPGVCPAPDPSMVDYVLIFTHDNNFYGVSMPDPVHTDRNGFSDWSPVTAVDDSLFPSNTLDKAHREYAWVFRVHRGSFDPARFSAHRRPQFTKTEHGSSKAAEDAFAFISQGGAGQ